MFDKVLAIQESKAAMETQLGAIRVETDLLQAEHTMLAARVDEVESTLTLMHPTVVMAQNQLKTMQAEVWDLKLRAEDSDWC
ncbi:hypothetical protein NDU88_001199 [Pleurodeles waltl]|uniref:Uncharacterized protein n=1 Tax=Pleurodeles waltl TaxID=8319 RepID=A0AAV7MJV3_PLEWA|nr:hypothetical protein NDU88_001199 [Pleurodeles waltl]